MCKHNKVDVIVEDEQLLFTVVYCSNCDMHLDGYGKPVEYVIKEMITNG